jgi:hypothetical protein
LRDCVFLFADEAFQMDTADKDKQIGMPLLMRRPAARRITLGRPSGSSVLSIGVLRKRYRL